MSVMSSLPGSGESESMVGVRLPRGKDAASQQGCTEGGEARDKDFGAQCPAKNIA